MNLPVAVVERLAAFYDRNGYVRRRTIASVSLAGRRTRRCADELRLTAESSEEIRVIRRLLEQAGFKPGREFAKKRQFRIPVYGRRAVDRFLALVARKANAEDGPANGSQPIRSKTYRTPSAAGSRR